MIAAPRFCRSPHVLQRRTLEELVDTLAEHYSGDPDVIAADVAALLDTLVVDQVVLRIDA